MKCTYQNCEKDIFIKKYSLCKNHYQKMWYRRYHPPLPPINERFWSYVYKTDGCWWWTGAHNGKRYGSMRVGDTHKLAHRYSYELLVGSIADGMQIDHLCRNKLCVNPVHLEVVTSQINNQRRSSYWQNKKKVIL